VSADISGKAAGASADPRQEESARAWRAFAVGSASIFLSVLDAG